MYEVIRVRLGKNLGKCIFALLLFHLGQSFLYSFTLSPLMVSGRGGVPAYGTVAFSLVSTLCVVFLSFMFLYGILNFFTKTILARRDVMRVFSSGFRDKTRRAKKLSLFFTFIFAVCASLGTIVIMRFRGHIAGIVVSNADSYGIPAESLDFAKAIALAVVFCGVFFIAMLLLVLPFLFSYNVLFDDKKITVAGALKKSAVYMIPKFFHFIGFVIYVCIKNVIFISIIFAMNMYVSRSQSMIANLFSMLLAFFAFTQEYSIVAKAYASVPVYYYSLLSVNGLVDSGKRNESTSQ